MRFLLYTINYAPEFVGIGKYTTDLARWLKAKGHEVLVLTAPPYYPGWKVSEGYSSWRYQTKSEAGVIIYRCPLWVPKKPSGIKRLLHLISFALSSTPVLFWQSLRWRPDVIFLVEPPLSCAPATVLASKLSGSASWLHIQDFEVDAAFELFFISKGLRSPAISIERWLMQRFDRVSTISQHMLGRLIWDKGLDAQKCLLFRNWVDVDEIKPLPQESHSRRNLNLDPESCVVLYSGNLGVKQGLEILVAAATLLRDVPQIVFVISGKGVMKDSLQSLSDGLTNLRFLELQPPEQLNDLLNAADIHVLPQSGNAADLVMPSKLLGMFASGRPVVATAAPKTQIAEVVEGRGKVVPINDERALAQALLELYHSPDQRKRLGQAARQYAVEQWHRDKVLQAIEPVLQELGQTDPVQSEASVERLKPE